MSVLTALNRELGVKKCVQNLIWNIEGNESLTVSTGILTSDPAPGIRINVPDLRVVSLIATRKLDYFSILSRNDCTKLLRLRVNALDNVHPLGVIPTS